MNKDQLKAYFVWHFSEAKHHKTTGSEITYWKKLFGFPEISDPIIEGLGLSGMNVSPRFSYQPPNTRLPEHIDIDRIVGINFNLMPDPATVHLRGVPHAYEAALIDVGSIPHSVEPVPRPRLVLKLAIRAPWSQVYEAVRDHLVTERDDYRSVLTEEDEHKVKL